MNRMSVYSSNISSIGYEDGVLEVAFGDSSIYQYFNVPEIVYRELMAAPSNGECFYDSINNHYRYVKQRRTQ